ncbi:DUF6622 family protein [Aeromonas enteropelogenes]|uniref:DUF6622 family protein n=1 Tax=Aeromonas enteropelogenes TaxID=29489 RepID=UPI001CCE1194|nr:DUF6622 family protein [Aeromonas enteropelogenes]UBH28831.1 hypothetical protein LA358_06175 [Aeromonas enteropelogenes]
MLFLNIVAETPVWVWILFAFLVTTGINALSDREMDIKGLFIMPLFFLLWGGITVIDELSFLFWGLAAMLVGVMAGYGSGWYFASSGPQLKNKNGTNLIIWPGTPWVIVFVIITFIIKYTLNIFLNMEPELRFSLWFNIVFGFLSGLISGVLWGKTLSLYLKYRQTKSCS